MCSHGTISVLQFIGATMIALFSILFVWLGRKYKVSYYNSLLLGWFLYFVFTFAVEQSRDDNILENV